MRWKLLVVVGLMATTACGPRGAGSDPGLSGSAVPAVPDAAAPAQPFSAFRTGDLGVLRRVTYRLEAECMADAGFPQMIENPMPDEWLAESNHRLARQTDLGPTTVEQARALGFSVISDRRRPEWVSIISSDDAFDAALVKCRADAAGQLGTDSAATIRAYQRLLEQAYNRYVEAAEEDPRLDALFVERTHCLAEAGYRAADPAYVLRGRPDWGQYGIEPGSWAVDVPGEEPARVPGAVEVLQPPQKHYEPSEGEVAFALADLACRQELGLYSRLLGILVEHQREAMEALEPQFVELNRKLDALLARAAELED